MAADQFGDLPGVVLSLAAGSALVPRVGFRSSAGVGRGRWWW